MIRLKNPIVKSIHRRPSKNDVRRQSRHANAMALSSASLSASIHSLIHSFSCTHDGTQDGSISYYAHQIVTPRILPQKCMISATPSSSPCVAGG
mmetsp:Transcript_3332/g.9485  ORF Transcript_3332/g.9485 Transcript_3332/m.9485 type:complete len:94 (-) Transcript_3332:512-793(-)